MAVCTIKRSKEGAVLLTIDGRPDSESVEVSRAPHLHILEKEKQDYGLAIVSCAKVLTGDTKPKSEKSVDLSKLELTAFFSFMDPNDPTARMSPEIALWQFNTRFKKFANKDAKGRARELWLGYVKYMNKETKRSVTRKKPHASQNVVPSYT
jgi:hypothetical protein